MIIKIFNKFFSNIKIDQKFIGMFNVVTSTSFSRFDSLVKLGLFPLFNNKKISLRICIKSSAEHIAVGTIKFILLNKKVLRICILKN